MCTVSAGELISVPPKTELLCHGRLDQAITGDSVVCEPSEIPNVGAYVACTLAPNTKAVPIRILNLSDSEVRIHKGQKLGIVVVAEIEPEPDQESISIRKLEVKNDNWIEQFDTHHLEPAVRKKLHKLFRQYSDLFLEEGELLPKASQVKHSITLESGAQLICKAPYRIPYAQRKVLKQEIQRLLEAMVSTSSASKNPQWEKKKLECV